MTEDRRQSSQPAMPEDQKDNVLDGIFPRLGINPVCGSDDGSQMTEDSTVRR
jgi:hypothetical protein